MEKYVIKNDKGKYFVRFSALGELDNSDAGFDCWAVAEMTGDIAEAKILDEISAKAYILVLELEGFHSSKWTLEEVN